MKEETADFGGRRPEHLDQLVRENERPRRRSETTRAARAAGVDPGRPPGRQPPGVVRVVGTASDGSRLLKKMILRGGSRIVSASNSTCIQDRHHTLKVHRSDRCRCCGSRAAYRRSTRLREQHLVYVKNGGVYLAQPTARRARPIITTNNDWAWPSETDAGMIAVAGGLPRTDGTFNPSGSDEVYRVQPAGRPGRRPGSHRGQLLRP